MRLIDADKLIKQFHYGGIADTYEDKAWTATVRRTIKAQPTAYDIDKVVSYIDRVANSGLGKSKSLEYIKKYVKAVRNESDNKRP